MTTEQKLLEALKGAIKFFEYSEAFRNRTTSRNEMEEVLQKWKKFAPSSLGIGIGATYGSDATFEYDKWTKLVAEVEAGCSPHYTKADCPTGCGQMDCQFCGESPRYDPALCVCQGKDGCANCMGGK